MFGLQNDGMRYLTARIDRLAAGRFGLNAGEIQDALRVWIDGRQVGLVLEGPIRTPLVIRGAEISRRSSVDFARVPMVSPDGKVVELSQLADVRMENGPIQVIREEAQRFATILANVSGRDLVGFVDEAKTAVAKDVSAAGIRFEWGGQFENQQRASARLAIVVPMALALIFLLALSDLQLGATGDARVLQCAFRGDWRHSRACGFRANFSRCPRPSALSR